MAVKALWLLVLAASAAFGALYSSVMNPWAATALGLVTVAVILLVLAAILALVGRSQIAELKKKVDISEDVKIGAETVKSGHRERQGRSGGRARRVPTPELDLR